MKQMCYHLAKFLDDFLLERFHLLPDCCSLMCCHCSTMAATKCTDDGTLENIGRNFFRLPPESPKQKLEMQQSKRNKAYFLVGWSGDDHRLLWNSQSTSFISYVNQIKFKFQN